MIKTVLKAEKITLYMIDHNLIKRIFTYQKDRKHNYQTVQVGSHFLQAIYISEEDYQDPCFKDVDEINAVFNPKMIALPLMDPYSNSKKPLMVL